MSQVAQRPLRGCLVTLRVIDPNDAQLLRDMLATPRGTE
jgi:hypothetical protein